MGRTTARNEKGTELTENSQNLKITKEGNEIEKLNGELGSSVSS